MTKWLKDELRPDGIRVNCLAPGLIQTDFSKALWEGKEGKTDDTMGQPWQIGSVAAMMCSRDGSFINGETYGVNGGYPKL